MKKSARLVFFGTEDFSIASFEALIEAGWDIVAVVTKPDSKSGRGRLLSPPPIKEIAELQNIPVLQPKKITDAGAELAALVPTHGVLVSYGAIIPPSILELFQGGIINLHPSLLPAYRGPSPIESAILNGDKQTGLTLMQLNEKMDAGPIYAQKVYPLNGQEDQISLSEVLAAVGGHFLIEKLYHIVSGFIDPVPQDESRATYSKMLEKKHGRINWKTPAELIERQIRAFIRFPRSKTKINGNEIIITKARVAASETDGKLVKKCMPGWLEIIELVAPSGRTMSGGEFARGYLKSKKLPGA